MGIRALLSGKARNTSNDRKKADCKQKEQPQPMAQGIEPRRKKAYVKPTTSIIHVDSPLMAPIASIPIDPSDTEAKGNPYDADEDTEGDIWSGVSDFDSNIWE